MTVPQVAGSVSEGGHISAHSLLQLNGESKLGVTGILQIMVKHARYVNTAILVTATARHTPTKSRAQLTLGDLAFKKALGVCIPPVS